MWVPAPSSWAITSPNCNSDDKGYNFAAAPATMRYCDPLVRRFRCTIINHPGVFVHVHQPIKMHKSERSGDAIRKTGKQKNRLTFLYMYMCICTYTYTYTGKTEHTKNIDAADYNKERESQFPCDPPPIPPITVFVKTVPVPLDKILKALPHHVHIIHKCDIS